MDYGIYCGVDFHARRQTICCLTTEDGVIATYELKHDKSHHKRLGVTSKICLDIDTGFIEWLCLIRYDANVLLGAGIDFEVAGKLTTESCDLDGLARAQAANVDTR